MTTAAILQAAIGAPATLIPPTIVAVGTSQTGTGSPTYDLATGTPTIAATLLDGDILFFPVETAAETPGANPPSGFTALASPPILGTPGGVDSTAIYGYWKRISGAQADVSLGDAGDHTFSRGILVRGCRKVGTPVVVIASGTAAAEAEPVPLPSGSTTVPQSLVMYLITHSEDTATPWITSWSVPILSGGAAVWAPESGTTVGNGAGLAAYAGVAAMPGSLGSPTIDIKNIIQPGNYAKLTIAFIPENG